MNDMDIHFFCSKYDILSKFLLTDGNYDVIFIINFTTEQMLNSSGKLIELKKQLKFFHEKNSRVLIFSQFTQVLSILEDFLTRLGYNFLRMDGQTPVLDRQALIDEYNTNRVCIINYYVIISHHSSSHV